MKRKFIFINIILVLLLLLLLVGYKNLKVAEIKCSSQYGPCDQEVATKLKSFEGEKIISTYQNINDLLGSDHKVANYKLNFAGPLHIEAEINQRKPSVAVQASGDSKYYLYSEDGYLLSIAKETQLPTINLLDKSVATINQTKFVIEMAYALNQTYNVNMLVVRDGGMEFEVLGAPKIVYPIQGDIDVLLGSLTFVLSQLNTQLGDFKMESVDFRFKNPVIRVL